MQSHCQHNLYICHCSPSSQDPSPIHPPILPLTQTTTLHRFPAKRNGNVKVTVDSNGELVKHPVYVSHSSVAVMTSPTMHINTLTKRISQPEEGVINSASPSTASSCSSLPTTMMTSTVPPPVMQQSNGTLNRYSQHLGTYDITSFRTDNLKPVKIKILSFVKKKIVKLKGDFFPLDIMVQNLFEHLVL